MIIPELTQLILKRGFGTFGLMLAVAFFSVLIAPLCTFRTHCCWPGL